MVNVNPGATGPRLFSTSGPVRSLQASLRDAGTNGD